MLGNLGRYREAEVPIPRALAIHEQVFGRESSHYASSLFNLAYALVG